jgi:hypothetical protein
MECRYGAAGTLLGFSGWYSVKVPGLVGFRSTSTPAMLVGASYLPIAMG